MKQLLFLLLLSIIFNLQAQIKNEEEIIDKWTKATLNVLCYSETTKKNLALLDSVYAIGQIDSLTYHHYARELISSPSRGTAIWVTYENHNFLVSARHVLEDLSLGEGNCYTQIHIIDNDTNSVVDLNMYHPTENGNFVFEIGNAIDIIIVNNPLLYKFSSANNDLAVINLDSVYYAYGLFPFLRINGYEPVDILDIDSRFKVKKKEPIIAIGYPQESITKIKSENELPTKYALISSPIITIPFITRGTVFNTLKGKSMFESDIFIYHGFSGGPIINRKGKLIGITHGFSRIKKQTSSGNYFDFHGKFIKSSLIEPLIQDVLKQVKSETIQSQHI